MTNHRQRRYSSPYLLWLDRDGRSSSLMIEGNDFQITLTRLYSDL